MRKRLWIGFIAAVMLIVLVVCGCSADNKSADMAYSESSTASYSGDYGYDNAAGATEEVVVEDAEIAYEEVDEVETTAESVESVDVQENTKIIRTVNLHMETLYFDELTQILTQKAAEYGGYVESSDVTNRGYYSSSPRYGYYVVRIPADKADEYMESMGDKGTVVSKSEYLEDVTLQYVDTKSHIEMLEVERERLMELLDKAESLEDILIIEERLTNIRYELEAYESKLKVMDNKISYTTINIDVSEVEQISTPEEASIGKKIADGFQDSIRGIMNGFEALVVFMIARLPYIILVGLLLTILIVVVKKKIKNK